MGSQGCVSPSERVRLGKPGRWEQGKWSPFCFLPRGAQSPSPRTERRALQLACGSAREKLSPASWT